MPGRKNSLRPPPPALASPEALEAGQWLSAALVNHINDAAMSPTNFAGIGTSLDFLATWRSATKSAAPRRSTMYAATSGVAGRAQDASA